MDLHDLELKCFSFSPLYETVFNGLLNASIESDRARQNVEQCHPLQKNMTVKLTNEQVHDRSSSVKVYVFYP